MKIKTTCATNVLIICYLSGVAVASADTMVITYRSGKVQNVAMDEPSDEVKDIGYLKIPVPLPETRAKELPDTRTGADKEGRKERSPDSKKHGITIEWAPPLDQ
ncbi:protein-tyrosine phosphatase family protein [Geotalea uraniireducens]|uniref:Uncharacterized protein n=1 Tax=Geotalea uraniireducens (strain Rf4) TaxID=351605 RepID=A5GCM3_GEOUR|nr:hypothetical protein [Geotalea uraniireducens]ABQ24677.1 hypothetical protein Gura_0461 [Geotalea uraniireducens Rf4]